MIDFLIVQSILSSMRARPSRHSAAETALIVVYLVVYVAAIVTATALRRSARAEPVSIAVAINSPLMYFLLFPFGAFALPLRVAGAPS